MESKLFYIALVLVIFFLILINYLLIKSRYKRKVKVAVFVLSLTLALPLWYFIQYPILFVWMAVGTIFPRSNITPCWMIPVAACKKNPYCEVQFDIGGLGNDSLRCVSKPSTEELMPLKGGDNLKLCRYYQTEREYELAKNYCQKAIEEYTSVNKNGKYNEQIKEANKLMFEM